MCEEEEKRKREENEERREEKYLIYNLKKLRKWNEIEERSEEEWPVMEEKCQMTKRKYRETRKAAGYHAWEMCEKMAKEVEKSSENNQIWRRENTANVAYNESNQPGNAWKWWQSAAINAAIMKKHRNQKIWEMKAMKGGVK